MNYDSTDLSTISERAEQLKQLLRREGHPVQLARHLADDTVLRAYITTPKVVSIALDGLVMRPPTLRDLITLTADVAAEVEAPASTRPEPNRAQRRAYQQEMARMFKRFKKIQRK